LKKYETQRKILKVCFTLVTTMYIPTNHVNKNEETRPVRMTVLRVYILTNQVRAALL